MSPEDPHSPDTTETDSAASLSRRTFIAASTVGGVAAVAGPTLLGTAPAAALEAIVHLHGPDGERAWKLPAVERHLLGKRPSASLWTEAAELAAEGARPLAHNGFKVELLKRTVERQLRVVGGTR